MNQFITPFRALNELHRELGRVFDDSAYPRTVTQSTWTPQVDIRETETGYSVSIDLPGIDPKDVDITVHKNVLTIRGERESDLDEAQYKRRERALGTFQRQFSLPDNIDEAGVSASADNGVLVISLPRIIEAKPLTITVESD